MNAKSKPILIAVAAIVLIAPSAFFFMSSSSERQRRIQKERELSQQMDSMSKLEAQVAELNKSMAGYRETSQKRINALEMSVREKEESARVLKEEVDLLKKDKETALHDSLEKGSAISELTDRLAALQEERDNLLKSTQELKKTVETLKAQLEQGPGDRSEAVRQELPASSEPYGILADKDLGAALDPVNLGTIVVSKTSGRVARVQEVNQVYDFIVLDAGEKDGIREGSVMNIVRRNTLIGKAVVRHTRPGVSAAMILPEWKKVPVEKGDLITKF